MKNEKTLTINFELKFDTLYVFQLMCNSSFQIIAKNVSFTISTDQDGLAMYCRNENNICKTQEYKEGRKGYALSIITNECKCISISTFDKFAHEKIESLLLLKINEIKANRTSASINTDLIIDDSKDAVSTRTRDNSKKKESKMNIRSFVSIIAQLLIETKSSLRESLYNSEFSFKEAQRICAKKINEICAELTLNVTCVNISMKNSIIKLLNQSSFTRATV